MQNNAHDMNANTLLQKIRQALQDLHIVCNENELQHIDMPHSQTNQFQQITDRAGRSYLIRINGCLWPPFSRETESENLNLLHRQGIATNVLHNGDGFQICNLLPIHQRFSSITDEIEINDSLQRIGRYIKNYQLVTQFANDLSIREMIETAFTRIPSTGQQQLVGIRQIINGWVSHVENDNIEKVSSHNDLLPSSVYNNNGTIAVVDWEYSACNHPYYDLAHFSVKSSLTTEQDEILLQSYDAVFEGPVVAERLSFLYLKAIFSFIMYLWNRNPQQNEELLRIFLGHFQNAFVHALQMPYVQ